VSVGSRSAERGSGGGSEVGTIPSHTSKASLIIQGTRTTVLSLIAEAPIAAGQSTNR
jgi:hypothetical protein